MAYTTERRAPTPAEREGMAAADRRWAASHAARRSSPWELGAPALVLLALAGIAASLGWGVAPFLALGGVGAGAMALWMATQNARAVAPPSTHPAADEVFEHTLHARRVVFAIDDRGDGQLYILFERPDGLWHLLVDEHLPYDVDLIDILSHEVVRWSETPSHLPLRVWSEGERIPTRGLAGRSERAVEEAVAAGFVWSPEALDVDDDAIPADRLPAWITDWGVDPDAATELPR